MTLCVSARHAEHEKGPVVGARGPDGATRALRWLLTGSMAQLRRSWILALALIAAQLACAGASPSGRQSGSKTRCPHGKYISTRPLHTDSFIYEWCVILLRWARAPLCRASVPRHTAAPPALTRSPLLRRAPPTHAADYSLGGAAVTGARRASTKRIRGKPGTRCVSRAQLASTRNTADRRTARRAPLGGSSRRRMMGRPAARRARQGAHLRWWARQARQSAFPALPASLRCRARRRARPAALRGRAQKGALAACIARTASSSRRRPKAIVCRARRATARRCVAGATARGVGAASPAPG